MKAVCSVIGQLQSPVLFRRGASGPRETLEQFVPRSPPLTKWPKDRARGEGNRGASQTSEVSPFHNAALEIDELYRHDEWASAYWQDKSQERKELHKKVRRIVRPLGVVDLNEVANSIDDYAVTPNA